MIVYCENFEKVALIPRASAIGEPKETIRIEPVESPVPEKTPREAPSKPEPVEMPVEEPVEA